MDNRQVKQSIGQERSKSPTMLNPTSPPLYRRLRIGLPNELLNFQWRQNITGFTNQVGFNPMLDSYAASTADASSSRDLPVKYK